MKLKQNKQKLNIIMKRKIVEDFRAMYALCIVGFSDHITFI